MDQEPLCQQHLPTAQHAAPAAVCGPGGTLQLRELPPVGQPNPGHESQTEPVHLVWEEVKKREDEKEKKIKREESPTDSGKQIFVNYIMFIWHEKDLLMRVWNKSKPVSNVKLSSFQKKRVYPAMVNQNTHHNNPWGLLLPDIFLYGTEIQHLLTDTFDC